ncbi:MAG: Mut7-C RNAse domain-containing protein [Candidatus Cloacimonadales bacterium]|nr:Mut7-C RNAse domain-containing protein [Candidatus Cloacimonadales bacterium]
MLALKPKFLLSENLNRLAKWLRLLGYDAAIYKAISTDKMINLANKERRILLTRSNKIAVRKEKFSRILIKSEFHTEQLKEIRSYLVFSREHIFTRCLICNKILFAISRDKVWNLVPEFVLNSIKEYKVCRKCGKIYWPGSHYKNMLEVLRNIFD